MPTQPASSADLSAALAARVLHDIAGQTSGLVTAFDLLADPGAASMRQEALALAEQSTRRLARTLTLQRAILTPGGMLAGSTLEAAARELFMDVRGSLELRLAGDDASPLAGRVLLGLLQIAGSAAMGGIVSASLEPQDEETRVFVTVRGARARLREEERNGLRGDGPDGGQLHRWSLAYWLWTLVSEGGGRVSVQVEDGSFAIEASIARAID